MRAKLLSLAGALLLASCATPPTESTRFYRAYSGADLPPPLRAKVAEIEKRHGVVAASAEITRPSYAEAPRPFNVELRRGRQTLSITVLALIDASGRTVECFVLDASDDDVAKEAGPVMRAARYHPALLDGKPVACAETVTIEGAGIPR